MKLRYKITGGIVVLLGVTTTVLAVMMSHNAACESAPPPAGTETMRAIVYRCYGPPDVIALEDIARPGPADDELLVRVRAAAVNPLDWHFLRGTPYFIRLFTGMGKPDFPRLGVDFAGTVEAVGKDVTLFEPGDDVFGGAGGAFAEYVTIPESHAMAHKPASVSFEEAAAIPIAAETALQALRDKGGLQAGQTVLINGASGGVGTYAVQLARSFGAKVTGVCSTRNLELVRALGADRVIDYTVEDYTEGKDRYDLIVDMVGNHSLSDNRRVMTANGRLIMVGGQPGNWFGGLMSMPVAAAYSKFVDQNFVSLLSDLKSDELALLADLMQKGEIRSVIDRRYALDDVAGAIRYSEQGHARGKIVIAIDPRPAT